MRPTTSGAAFAAANAAMVQGVDGTSTVHMLLADCIGILGAESAGVLVRIDEGLDLLAATSHKSVELELYQVQSHSGPCVETIETGRAIAATGTGDLRQRWPSFGRAMSSAGLETVLASPLRWHGRVLGGLNVFWADSTVPGPAERDVAQAFADTASLALMQFPQTGAQDTVNEQLRHALHGRVEIERAKGVLAETDRLQMDEAFERLIQMSEESGRPLSAVARDILDGVVRPRP